MAEVISHYSDNVIPPSVLRVAYIHNIYHFLLSDQKTNLIVMKSIAIISGHQRGNGTLQARLEHQDYLLGAVGVQECRRELFHRHLDGDGNFLALSALTLSRVVG